MEFVHTADWHPHSMGTIAGKLVLDTATGLSLTLTDFQNSLNFLFEYLQERSIPLLLVAGDVFDNSKPTMDELRVVMEFFERCSNAGIECVIIPGNHDIAQHSHLATALATVKFQTVHLEQKPASVMLHIDGQVVRIDCLPYPSRGRMLAQMQEKKSCTPEELLAFMNRGLYNILHGFQMDGFQENLGKADYKILLAHGSVETAVVGEQPRTLAHDLFLPVLDIEQHYDYVALGHIHQTQAIGDRTMYSGSLLRQSFGEEKERKGFLVVDCTLGGGMTTTHIENPHARVYRTLKVDSLPVIDEATIDKAVVYRIKDEVPEEAWPVLQPLITKFLDLVPFVQINVEIVKPDRMRDSQLNNQMNSTEALERCLERDGVQEPGLSLCREMHLQLCEEVST